MKESREIDVLMAQQILGHTTYHEKSGAMRERLPSGQSRPLRNYTLDISAAWEVVQQLGMTMIPVEEGWFALVGKKRGWESPAKFLVYLQTADFANSGAAVGEHAPMTICMAAMKALDNRQLETDASQPALGVKSEASMHH